MVVVVYMAAYCVSERGAKAASEDAPLTQRTQPAAHAVGIILHSIAKISDLRQ